jgi:thymidylate synthase (FAD)
MANAVFEIETTRDIARQILRHRSFSFQEFSQRYADVNDLPIADLRDARLQDNKNRQNSVETDNTELCDWWLEQQVRLETMADGIYNTAVQRGIAKEVARAVLPEGLTTSRMYMNGTMRSWMTYCKLRTGNGTQKEHQEIAKAISDEMEKILPLSWSALMSEEV